MGEDIDEKDCLQEVETVLFFGDFSFIFVSIYKAIQHCMLFGLRCGRLDILKYQLGSRGNTQQNVFLQYM